MLRKPDRYMQAFIECAGQTHHPAVDIGAAFGVATIPALEAGAQVIAVDLDERHLQQLENSLSDELKQRFSYLVGRFPLELEFQANSIGAILLSRIVHFLDGDTLALGVERLFEWCAPGGKVFLTAETPYLKSFQHFIPIYEQRKANNEPWPGYCDQPSPLEIYRNDLPEVMLFLDDDDLNRIFLNAGFEVERVELFERPEFPDDVRLDGRESVGIIARKPI